MKLPKGLQGVDTAAAVNVSLITIVKRKESMTSYSDKKSDTLIAAPQLQHSSDSDKDRRAVERRRFFLSF